MWPLTQTLRPLTSTVSVRMTRYWFANVGLRYLRSSVAVTPIWFGSE